MCGITGFIQYRGSGVEELKRRCQVMTDTLVHRGPDADGVWADAATRVALGHRRLSIIELAKGAGSVLIDRIRVHWSETLPDA